LRRLYQQAQPRIGEAGQSWRMSSSSSNGMDWLRSTVGNLTMTGMGRAVVRVVAAVFDTYKRPHAAQSATRFDFCNDAGVALEESRIALPPELHRLA
jgi:hypothetical protein